ncbi:unnamed protein product, partial [marine sediment metagenome]
MNYKLERNEKTVAEILKKNEIKEGQRWGGWVYRNFTLKLEEEIQARSETEEFWDYEIDLRRCL